jgi:hypothetical protein
MVMALDRSWSASLYFRDNPVSSRFAVHDTALQGLVRAAERNVGNPVLSFT